MVKKSPRTLNAAICWSYAAAVCPYNIAYFRIHYQVKRAYTILFIIQLLYYLLFFIIRIAGIERLGEFFIETFDV